MITVLPPNLQTLARFSRFSQERPLQQKGKKIILFCVYDPGSLSNFVAMSLNLEQVIHLSLSFMTLKFLKSTNQLFCRMSLNSGFSAVSSRLDSGHTYLVALPQKWYVLTIWTCPITGGVNFEHLLKIVSDAS